MTVVRVAQASVEARVALPRLSLGLAGLAAVLVGVWVGAVAFVGPLFGYSGDGSGPWYWDAPHAYLFLVPGAAVFFAGVFSMVATLNSERAVLGLCGTVVLLAGGWLVIGPVAWPVLSGQAFFATHAPPLRELSYWAGYALGPGGLLLVLGAFILGSDRLRARPVAAPTVAAPSGRAPTP